MPTPRGPNLSITAFVGASFAQDKKTRKSHTGFIIFVNRAPITWFSKRQSTVETSTFSAEFMAMKSCVSAIESLRFKLRMVGFQLKDLLIFIVTMKVWLIILARWSLHWIKSTTQ